MSSTGPEQVTIDVERLNDHPETNKQMDSLKAGEIATDGRHSRGHQRHGSNGSHHHSHHSHSGESDAEDKNRSRRSRRRSRSRSRSPSHRAKRATENSVPSTEKDVVTNSHDVEPLLVTNVHHTKKHTELDEDDSDDSVTQHEENPGVDDGFFVGTRAETDETNDKFHPNVNHNNNIPHENPSTFPFGFNPNVILDANGNPQVVPDINVYQQKKNLAQGMMDLALLSANANQLRYVVETYPYHPYYWFSLISISISLILQVAVGVGLILNSRYNVKNKEQICRADKVNNLTVIGIFLITAVNVFITAFGVAPSESKPN